MSRIDQSSRRREPPDREHAFFLEEAARRDASPPREDGYPREHPDGTSPAGRWKKEAMEWIKTLAAAFVIVFFLHHFVFNLSVVEGQSMQPTLEQSERLFVNKAAYLFGEPRRGDVVILRNPGHNREQYLVKRVVGVPGDVLEIRQNKLYVNGELYDRPYSADAPVPGGDEGPIDIPPGYYYVLGDNRSNSLDSRYFGLVAGSLIEGRADFILWPLSKAGDL